MSSEIRDLSRIRHLLTEKRKEIMTEIANKKSIGKKQCQQWIDHLVDVVITYDNRLDSHNFALNASQIIDSKRKHHNCGQNTVNTEDEEKEKKVLSPTKRNKFTTNIDEVNDESLAKQVNNTLSTISDDIKGSEEKQIKNVMKGLKFVKTIDDYSHDSDPEWNYTSNENKSKNKPSKNKKKINKPKSIVLNTSDGKVVGGDTTSTSTPLLREMLAKAAEHRLAQLESRGSKGVVKLPKISDKSDVNNASNLLKWKM